MMLKKNTLFGIMVMIVTILLLFVLLEIGIRVIAPQRTYKNFESMDAPVFSESEIIPWTLSANVEGEQRSPYDEFISYVKTNSLGMRGPEPIEKSSSVKRILILGDSFTYGFGISEYASFPRQTEALLNKQKGTTKVFEVLNAGYASGYTTDQYYVYLVNKLEELNPDYVVIAFYTGNDIADLSTTRWDLVDENGLPQKISSPQYYIDEYGRRRIPISGIFKINIFYKTHLWLYSHFHSYVLFKKSVDNILQGNSKTYFSNQWTEKMDENWNNTESVLSATVDLLNKKDIPIFIVLINSRVQTVDDIWDTYKQQYDPDSLNRTKPNDLILDFCKKQEIKCLDLGESFSNQENQSSVYFSIDGHWNEKGHSLAAREISEFIELNS